MTVQKNCVLLSKISLLVLDNLAALDTNRAISILN